MADLKYRLKLCSARLNDAMNSLDTTEEHSLEHKLFQDLLGLQMKVDAEVHKINCANREYEKTWEFKAGRTWGEHEEDPQKDALESFNKLPREEEKDNS